MNNSIFNADHVLFLDGGMGTQLQAKGLQPGEIPELWNLSRPQDVRAVHEAYFSAGADIVYANTFGANPAKYHGDAPLADVIQAGISIALEAARHGCASAQPRRLVALDVGPTGRLLKPAGDFEFDAAYDAFAEQIRTGAKAGADIIAIETMGDAYELKAAVLAAKENSQLPILATVALGDDGKLLTGASVECVAALLEGLRVDALGFNCGFGPDRMLPYLKRLAAATSLPIAVKPNAGLPKVVDGRTVFTVGPDEFARDVAALADAGASIVGGCCGTTPAHIGKVVERLSGKLKVLGPEKTDNSNTQAPKRSTTIVSSGSRAVEIPFNDTIVIGERINPTGKKKLKAALTEGDVAYVLREAVAQAEAGAHILDVNVGVPGLDEPAVLDSTIQAVQSVTDLPLQIDTSDPKALERALRHYNGKALVNSVNGKEESMSAVLPLVAKYGGAVVALTLDETGIPPNADGRIAIAKKILARGAEHGLKPSDFIIDVLCLAVSADAQSANVILESMRRARNELGCRTCLGVSNISFGLPARPLLNAAFYTMALANGLAAGIVNPLAADMMTAYRAFRALTAKDTTCSVWIDAFKDWSPTSASTAVKRVTPDAATSTAGSSESPLSAAIRHGLKADAAAAAKDSLANGTAPLDIISLSIVPALEVVGKGFESGSVFLPQLLMAAEAAGSAFEVVRAALPSCDAGSVRGPIIMATVKGDIHDIGKNICRALLENYGFKVIDLGRDVPPEKVVEAAKREKARLVGLSALMTTTVCFMEQTVQMIHAELPDCKVTVGGAVLTPDYAAKIGADHYSKDAMGLVRYAEQLFP